MVVAVFVGGCASTDPGVVARDASPIASPDDEVVRDDPDVRILTLSNGLTVYVRSNDRPGGSVEMRLAINAGSGQEDPDQSAVAHFLEHMLFNGTTEFPANELIDTLRGFGMAFGAVAAQKVFTLAEAVAMTGLVYAGMAQFVAVP